MDYIISISYIAIITGDNIYQTKRDFLIKYWKQNDKNDFDIYSQITKYSIKNDLQPFINNISYLYIKIIDNKVIANNPPKHFHNIQYLLERKKDIKCISYEFWY